jgi:hypothetical protein
MDMIADIATAVLTQLQKPTLAFLMGGVLLAALGSKLEVPAPVYKFIVILLLLKVGLGAGISVRKADLISLAVPAVCAALVGIAIVLLGRGTLARLRGVSRVDGLATAGLFGAVSASTLAAGMAVLDDEGIAYEGFIGALYPFMDIAALVTAIVLGRIAVTRQAAVNAQCGWYGNHGAWRRFRRRRLWRRRWRHDQADPGGYLPQPGHLGPAAGHRPRHRHQANRTLRGLLRVAVPRAAVHSHADHGHGGLAAAARTAQGCPCLRAVRPGCTHRPRADRVRRGCHCPPPDGLLGRRGGAAVCHGCLEL